MTNFFVLTTILAIIGEGYCGYRLGGGGGGYAVQGIQQAASVQEEKISSSSSTYGASESGYVGGGYGGSGVYGGAASAASSAVYEQAQSSQSQSYSGSSLDVASSGVSGYNAVGGGLGRSASYGGYSAVRSQQQQSSYSASSTSTTVNYSEYWPALYQDQFFRSICELDSFHRSAQLTQTFLAQKEIDYYSTFSSFYSQNALLQKYIFACTGFITESDAERQIFFNQIVSQQPATIIRSLLLFAVHPRLFNSKLANLIIAKTSTEIIQTATSSSWSFSYWQEPISYIVRSRTYRSVLYNDESSLWSALSQSYDNNRAGVLLLLRHVLSRRTLYARQQYFSLDFNTYVSHNSIFSRKLFKATYYNQYQSYKSSQSTYSSTSTSGYDSSLIGGSGYGVSSDYGVRQAATTASSTVSQSSQSIQQAGYGSSSGIIGGSGIASSGLSSGYSASRVSQKTTTTTTSTAIYESYYPELYKDNLFQSLCGIDSFVRSEEIYQRESSFLSSYDYQKRFSNVYSNNAIFKNYFRAAIGLSFEEIENESFFSYVRENPGYFLRTIHLYAKHPLIFKNRLTEYVFAAKSSFELIQTSESVISSYFQESYLQLLVKSATYRSTFASLFQCDESAVFARLKWAYAQNHNGFLLLLRHVFSRRSLFQLEDYLSINTKVWQTKSSFFSKRSYLSNTYYKRFASSRSSSFSSTQSFKKSKRSVKRSASGKFRSFGKKRNSSDSSD
ncbi:uncharacterized protein LOC142332604 isoform X2 [Lycorma delicatula]|uniref:uncharacterized protein LOC142332604 isoform X2 n=1 Tax=Lycorma delicatula TaxID=130591 RepID=UPI003F5162BB